MQQYPFLFSDDIRYRVRRHLVLWFAWWLFSSILYSYTAGLSLFPSYKRLPIAMVDAFFFLAPHMFLSYSLMYFVIPKFVIRGKYVTAVLLLPVLFVLTACISSVLALNILPPVRHYLFSTDTFNVEYPRNLAFFLSLLAGLRGGITIAGLAAAIKLVKYWYVKEQRNRQLEKENMAAQLQLLKAQIHPHFLFNTMNNIYSLTQNSSPVAARMVSGLSDMLRFMLYEGSQRTVPLDRELKLIRDYIELEQIRYGNKLEIQLDLPADTLGLHIAPLLLLPLVENSFKHGASQMLDQPWISLRVTLHNNIMHLKLINSKRPDEQPEGKKGIGIENVQKRLALLYPGAHELVIESDTDVFVVNLKIRLEENTRVIHSTTASQRLSYA